jgi:hypothetical protein
MGRMSLEKSMGRPVGGGSLETSTVRFLPSFEAPTAAQNQSATITSPARRNVLGE